MANKKRRAKTKSTSTESPSPAVINRIAAHFGKGIRTVKEWMRAGCPATDNLSQVEEWLRGRKKGNGQAKDADFWQCQFRMNKAKLAELDLKIRRGELLPRAEVLMALSEIQSIVKKNLALIPRIAPGRMVGQDSAGQRKVLDSMIQNILLGMAQGQAAKKIEKILRNG